MPSRTMAAATTGEAQVAEYTVRLLSLDEALCWCFETAAYSASNQNSVIAIVDPRCICTRALSPHPAPNLLCLLFIICRTAGTAASPWFSSGKPVTDCTSQYSPNPSRAALKAANVPVAPVTPGGDC